MRLTKKLKWRAHTRPSPPLLPGPQRTRIFDADGYALVTK